MNKNKILTAIMAGTMMMGSTLPVFAASTVTDYNPISQEEIGKDGITRPTEVEYKQVSTFSVTIPKKIILGEEKNSDYNVNVKGDISSTDQVKVAPITKFDMVDVGTEGAGGTRKANVEATVTQNETIWSSAEVCKKTEDKVLEGTDKKGNVSALDLTSGTWEGTFTFNIALEAAE